MPRPPTTLQALMTEVRCQRGIFASAGEHLAETLDEHAEAPSPTSKHRLAGALTYYESSAAGYERALRAVAAAVGVPYPVVPS